MMPLPPMSFTGGHASGGTAGGGSSAWDQGGWTVNVAGSAPTAQFAAGGTSLLLLAAAGVALYFILKKR